MLSPRALQEFRGKKMKVIIDEEVCIGCGFCASICPQVFRVKEQDEVEKAEVYGAITSDVEESANEAMVSCPVSAISEE